MANQFSIISPSYCAPNSVNLQINTEKGATHNTKGRVVFYMKDTFFTLQNRRVLCDDKGNPVVTLFDKNMKMHERCEVFRGKSSDPSELLFSVKSSSLIQSGSMIKLDVFLANNKDESMCDFRIIVRGNKSSCTVYDGESPTIVAKMKNNGSFNVWIYPNVDYAFIVTLLMIINKMDYSHELTDSAIHMATTSSHWMK